MAKTKKTMIYLGEVDHTRLKYMALDDGVSMAELIRQAQRGQVDHRRHESANRRRLRAQGKSIAKDGRVLLQAYRGGFSVSPSGRYRDASRPKIHEEATTGRRRARSGQP